MTDLDKQFAAAATEAKSLPAKPDNDTLLKLYALYKQGTDGDVHGDAPGFMDFVGRAKYEAWKEIKGMDQDKAKKGYVDLVAALKKRMT